MMTKLIRSPLKKRRAFSLVEVIIGIVILTIALLGIMSATSVAYDLFYRSKTKLVLLSLAESKLEEITSYMSEPTRTLNDLFNAYHGEYQDGSILLPDTAEMQGDYASYQREVFVEYVGMQNDTSGVPGGPFSLSGNLSEFIQSAGSTNSVMVTVRASKGAEATVRLVNFFFK